MPAPSSASPVYYNHEDRATRSSIERSSGPIQPELRAHRRVQPAGASSIDLGARLRRHDGPDRATRPPMLVPGQLFIVKTRGDDRRTTPSVSAVQRWSSATLGEGGLAKRDERQLARARAAKMMSMLRSEADPGRQEYRDKLACRRQRRRRRGQASRPRDLAPRGDGAPSSKGECAARRDGRTAHQDIASRRCALAERVRRRGSCWTARAEAYLMIDEIRAAGDPRDRPPER